MVRTNDRGLLAHVARAKTRSRTVARSAIKRNTDQCDIQALGIGNVRQAHKCRDAGEAGIFERVDGFGKWLGELLSRNLAPTLFRHVQNSKRQPAAGMRSISI